MLVAVAGLNFLNSPIHFEQLFLVLLPDSGKIVDKGLQGCFKLNLPLLYLLLVRLYKKTPIDSAFLGPSLPAVARGQIEV